AAGEPRCDLRRTAIIPEATTAINMQMRVSVPGRALNLCNEWATLASLGNRRAGVNVAVVDVPTFLAALEI
ncbi:MAG TPA: hypothetical protein VGM32_01895, partial [Rhodopila sp.]